MKPLGLCFAVVVAGFLQACVSATSPRWPTQERYVRIERWELAGGLGYSCTVARSSISIRTLNDFGKPNRVLFQRMLSPSEFRAVLDAVEESGLLGSLGKYRNAPVQEGVVQLSDGRLDRFSFRERDAAPIDEASVAYRNYTDDAARTVFGAVDLLLPDEYRFLRR